jgi:hypothetical protein
MTFGGSGRPAVGRFRLLEAAAVNHWGKLAFRWMYWNVLLPGRPSRYRHTCRWRQAPTHRVKASASCL